VGYAEEDRHLILTRNAALGGADRAANRPENRLDLIPEYEIAHVGDTGGGLRFTIGGYQLDLFAEQSAFRIDLVDSQLDPVQIGLAQYGDRAAQGGGQADLDAAGRHWRRSEAECQPTHQGGCSSRCSRT